MVSFINTGLQKSDLESMNIFKTCSFALKPMICFSRAAFSKKASCSDEMFCMYMVTISRMWIFGTYNVASATEELSAQILFNLNSHTGLMTTPVGNTVVGSGFRHGIC